LVLSRAAYVRAHVRTLSVILIDRHYDPRSADRFALLETVVDQLTRADLLLEQGQISMTKHELMWGLAYDRLAHHQPGCVERPRIS
jgi:hypothetical protein